MNISIKITVTVIKIQPPNNAEYILMYSFSVTNETIITASTTLVTYIVAAMNFESLRPFTLTFLVPNAKNNAAI